MFQTKEQDKSTETDLTETEISDLPEGNNGHKMLIKVRRAMHEQSENFNRNRKYF